MSRTLPAGPEGAHTAVTNPHAAEAIRVALAGLAKPISPRAAALHLALPVDVAPSIAVRGVPGGWRYRGNVVTETADPAADAAALAEAGHRDGDTYHDLSAAPVTWTKLIASGHRRVLFGTDTLFGAPLVAVADGVTRGSALEVLAGHLGGETVNAPSLVPTRDGTVLVEGNPGSWTLRPGFKPEPQRRHGLDLETQEDALAAIETCGRGLTSELQGTRYTFEVAGEEHPGMVDVEYTVDLEDGWVAKVPVSVSGASELVGVPQGAVQPGPGADVPEGYTYRGVAGGKTVAYHETSGTLLRLERCTR